MTEIPIRNEDGGPNWVHQIVSTVVFAVTVAAVLGIFSTLKDHQDRLVRLEVSTTASEKVLLEVRDDVKELLRKDNVRIGRESAHSN